MSGGHFDYRQNQIKYIADDLEKFLLEKIDNDYFDENNPSVINELFEGLKALRKAYVYAQRIDWLISGDDSETTFLNRLTEDLIKMHEEMIDVLDKFRNKYYKQ